MAQTGIATHLLSRPRTSGTGSRPDVAEGRAPACVATEVNVLARQDVRPPTALAEGRDGRERGAPGHGPAAGERGRSVAGVDSETIRRRMSSSTVISSARPATHAGRR